MKKTNGHIIAVHNKNKITYHFCQNMDEEAKLIGQIVGIYPPTEFLQHEKRYQDYHNEQLKKGRYTK